MKLVNNRWALIAQTGIGVLITPFSGGFVKVLGIKKNCKGITASELTPEQFDVLYEKCVKKEIYGDYIPVDNRTFFAIAGGGVR